MSLADYACADEPAHVFAYHADALAFLRSLPDEWVHAIITDPPYGLADHKPERVAQAITAWATGDRELVPTGKGFMGREWDAFVPPPAVWDECLRVLKPGGHLAVFAGSRTVDLMGLSIRLAGFEMRDGIAAWLYGSGFPKSLDVGKAIDKAAPREWQGWGTALKPAHEPILLARKPLSGTVAATVLAHRTGALNIDATRVAYEEGGSLASNPSLRSHINGGNGGHIIAHETERRVVTPNASGRWPTNVVLAHHPDCHDGGECAPGCQVAALDEQSGTATGAHGGHRGGPDGYGYNDNWPGRSQVSHGDSGSASRFFPTFRYQAKAPKAERPIVDGAGHPTVKPLGLMRWLVRLLVPGEVGYPDGSGTCGAVLDPFAGSGATLEAARLEGRRAVGVERDEHSVRLIAERLGVPVHLHAAPPIEQPESEPSPPTPIPTPTPTPTELLLAKAAVAESIDALMELYGHAQTEGLWNDEVRAAFTARKAEVAA